MLAVCLFLYNRKHPFGRPAIPDGHEYAADGVYFLRTAYSISSASGPVQWRQGQQVFEDRLAKTAAPSGMKMVTDGSHSASIPNNMLSEDVQEGEALRQVEIDAQSRVDAQAREQAQQRALDKAQADAAAQALARQKAEAQAQATAEAKAERDRLLAAQARQPTPTPKFGHTALDQPTQFKPARGGYYYYNGRWYPNAIPAPIATP